MRFQEITNDRGVSRTASASNNSAEYILTSARAKDMLTAFIDRYSRFPASSWYNRHFAFRRVK